MLNAYPDSMGGRLADAVGLLERPELADAFSLFYVLPTIFHSDLDRGFSIVDYGLNDELVEPADLERLDELGIALKLDFVLNHLSVASPQFLDIVARGDDSDYRDFFIDWNDFWARHSDLDPSDGHAVPTPEHLERLFMRKPGLPILRVRFPDRSDRFYWNTFYQQVTYDPVDPGAIAAICGLEVADDLAAAIDAATSTGDPPSADVVAAFGLDSEQVDGILAIVERQRRYLGQMDLNAESPLVWDFYADTFEKLKAYGARIVRLDAFAYLHKRVGESNFFNRPGTWEYLARLRELADENDLVLLPEIHSPYGTAIHHELATAGYPVYDFFFPGLVIDAIDRADGTRLLQWIDEVVATDIETVTMLGCHDGIPVIDLRGGTTAAGVEREGLLPDDDIDATIDRLLERGGRVKNLYGPDGTKISYYQVNATFFSALGEDASRLRLARAIQLFVPGTPQVWYLDLFAGTNDYEAADRAGAAGHKEINRTNLSLAAIEERLDWDVVSDQIDMIRLRNTSSAFAGELEVTPTERHRLVLTWTNGDVSARLDADLETCSFTITHHDGNSSERFSYR